MHDMLITTNLTSGPVKIRFYLEIRAALSANILHFVVGCDFGVDCDYMLYSIDLFENGVTRV